MDDGAGDAPRGALLAVEIEDVGERLCIRFVDDVGGARAPPFHAHVERSVDAEGKAARGLVELHRRDADVEDDAVERREALRARDLLELRKARFNKRQPSAHLVDERWPARTAVGIAVEREHARFRLRRMARV